MKLENYSLYTESIIKKIGDSKIKPSLLLHACCAPCSSAVLEYLNKHFEITLYFYNPNISTLEEFSKRAEELKRFVNEFPLENFKRVVIEDYDHSEFLSMVDGREGLKEGGARCYDCYKQRIEKSALYAQKNGFDMFTTTLSISPHKNAQWLNKIGKTMSEEYGVDYLYSDFKKKNGYKRSCELSNEYNLYRQSFCGCEFSKR
ncbi:MAG: epoxyqueuosine reductase QueH [Clostridia bacterium]|nr:epoxyqueuosine reductase QueH [Clostridia bacterium]